MTLSTGMASGGWEPQRKDGDVSTRHHVLSWPAGGTFSGHLTTPTSRKIAKWDLVFHQQCWCIPHNKHGQLLGYNSAGDFSTVWNELLHWTQRKKTCYCFVKLNFLEYISSSTDIKNCTFLHVQLCLFQQKIHFVVYHRPNFTVPGLHVVFLLGMLQMTGRVHRYHLSNSLCRGWAFPCSSQISPYVSRVESGINAENGQPLQINQEAPRDKTWQPFKNIWGPGEVYLGPVISCNHHRRCYVFFISIF